MNAPDFKSLLASITRCNAVYEVDNEKARASFASLGCQVISRYSTDTAQAILHTPHDGQLTLTIAGTRASEGNIAIRANDVFQDAEEIFSNHLIAPGVVVASGAYDRGCEIWNWASAFTNGDPIRIEGHSLGGQTTHVMLAIVHPDQYAMGIAWEPPKAGNDAFWSQYLTNPGRVTTIINGRDFWAAHPIESQTLRHPPGYILHLAGGQKWAWLSRDALPLAISTNDHNTDVVMEVVRGIVSDGASARI
jgi:hypothetical protein